MKIKALSTYLTLLLSLVTLFSSCEDRVDFSDYDIPEGSGEMTLTVDFPDLASTQLGGSRAAGNLIESINNIFVAVYNPQGQLMTYKYLAGPTEWTSESTTDKPADGLEKENPDDKLHWPTNPDGTATTTPRAKFTITDMPFGRYKIYAAANVGNLNDGAKEVSGVKTHEAIQTEAGLKSLSYPWNYNDISANYQMFGYFTLAGNGNEKSDGLDAPIVLFTPTNNKIHAWIKRLASKVTIAYDPRKLKDNVTIYIHSVTIRDIPQSCYLGQQNPQWSGNDAEGVHPLALYNRKTVDDPNDGVIRPNTVFNYDRAGIITTTPTNDPLRGIMLENGRVGQAAVAPGSLIQGSDHSTTAQALYFYENIQGNYEGNERFQKEMQERGKTDGVGQNITQGTYDENDVPINDYKDKVPYGTYIEVDAYYDASENLENPSKGPIKYRFMLGKNTTYNYNAARNHHYKLTLGFNGWANQPDWHIEYDEPDPGLYVPDTWHISYLYNQRSMLPIKLSGECTSLELKITDNQWYPYDPSTYAGPDNWPQTSRTYPNLTGETGLDDYKFTWYTNSVATTTESIRLSGTLRPELGFLALQVEGDTPEAISTSAYSTSAPISYQDRMTGINNLRDIYTNPALRQDIRTFGPADLELKKSPDGTRFVNTEYKKPGYGNNAYMVNPVEYTNGDQDPSQKVLVVPLWTRNFDLISGSGFSGNNPFEGYYRVANIQVTAYFKDHPEPFIQNCRVIQEKRITNPKGVWKEAGTKGNFHVQLMEQTDPENTHSDYDVLTSDGTWRAYISAPTTGVTFCSLEESGYPYAYKVPSTSGAGSDTIKGNTGSNIDFNIKFNGVGANETKCAVITVEYNGQQSSHKILVRQGYETPLTIGGNTWSSYTVYGCTYSHSDPDGTEHYNVEMTAKPLAQSSLFRREKQSRGILAKNEEVSTLGPMDAPGSQLLQLYGNRTESWQTIGSNVNINGTTYNYNGTGTNGLSITGSGKPKILNLLGNRSMGVFHQGSTTYRVPTLKDFKDLAEGCEYAFGIIYGDKATETKKAWDDVTGLIDPDNKGDGGGNEDNMKKGTRSVIVYNPKTGDQILFPLGKYGMGRRRQFNTLNNTYWGALWYSDLNGMLGINPSAPNNTDGSISAQRMNWYRPLVYNAKIDAGAVYWVDKWVAKDGLNNYYPGFPNIDTFGWDINYFNLDFKNFSDWNALDACALKLIIVNQ